MDIIKRSIAETRGKGTGHNLVSYIWTQFFVWFIVPILICCHACERGRVKSSELSIMGSMDAEDPGHLIPGFHLIIYI